MTSHSWTHVACKLVVLGYLQLHQGSEKAKFDAFAFSAAATTCRAQEVAPSIFHKLPFIFVSSPLFPFSYWRVVRSTTLHQQLMRWCNLNDDSFVPLQFIVKRKGLDCTEYGLVDGSVAKRQRLATDDGTKVFSPVTLDMVEDYEAFVKSFKRTVHHCKDEKGVLELGEFSLKLHFAFQFVTFH